jgi:hypothetical protein
MRSPHTPRRFSNQRATIEHVPPANCLRGVLLATALFLGATVSISYMDRPTDVPRTARCTPLHEYTGDVQRPPQAPSRFNGDATGERGHHTCLAAK